MAQYTRGRTNIADALEVLDNEMFNANLGDRTDVPNFAILVTDGHATVNEVTSWTTYWMGATSR